MRGGLVNHLEGHRLLIASGVFLTIESILIFAYGSSAYGGPDPGYLDPDGMNTTVWYVLSFTGCLLLGLIARSRWVIAIAWLPVLIAVPVGFPSDAPNVPGGEAFDLFLRWFLLMVLYLPVVALADFASKLAHRRRGSRLLAEAD